MSRLSRRDVFRASTLAAITPAAAGTLAPGAIAAPIYVGAGAGPAPLGAPVEAGVPLPSGAARDSGGLAILSPAGRPVVAQMRPASFWPDGSVRWLSVAFDADEGPGIYKLVAASSPAAAPMLRQEGGETWVDTGALRFPLPRAGAWFGDPLAWDLVLTRHDGKQFRASLSAASARVVVDENGPLRCAINVEGQCRAEDGAALFGYSVRLTAFRARPEVLISAAWINSTANAAEQLRDIRLTLPFRFAPKRLVFGCDSGVYDGPYLKDWPVYLLQENHDLYWAKTLNPDGRVQHLASGGANGRHCPGWLYLAAPERTLGVFVPNFWQEYPNEIAVRDGELSVGLWPERAAAALAAKPVLPRDPFSSQPYTNTKYWPVMPHPYVAFFDAEKRCLDTPRGLAKTQQILVSLCQDESCFERKHWATSLLPVRGHVDPAWLAATGAAGAIEPRRGGAAGPAGQLFDESFGWFQRHAQALQAYGKFDFGDFRYFTAGTDYLCTPGTKWGAMGEMAREGYWHNNERDTLRGLLLYYCRTADPAAWDVARSAAGHLFDVDICHHPHWGMYTHSYGHCYLALGKGGEPDHSWLAGMLLWADISGDAAALAAARKCGEHLLTWHPDPNRTDARSVSVSLHALCRFYMHSREPKFLDAAERAAGILVSLQNTDGGWPAYLGDTTKPRIEGFVEHAMLALADYYWLTDDRRVRAALDRAIEHLFPAAGGWKTDHGESPLALHALGLLAAKTGQSEYAQLARRILEMLHRDLNESPDLRARGDLWAGWGVNEEGASKVPGRPPQLLGQTRPLSPSSILAYGQECLAAIARLPR